MPKLLLIAAALIAGYFLVVDLHTPGAGLRKTSGPSAGLRGMSGAASTVAGGVVSAAGRIAD